MPSGRPHLATILGPAGIGKSRLADALIATLEESRQDSPLVLRGRCPAYGAEVGLWSFREVFRELFSIEATLPAGEDHARLRTGAARALEGADVEDPALVAERLASAFASGPVAPTTLDDGDAKLARDRLFSAIRSVIEAVASQRPLVLAIDDLHWGDDATLDLIEYLSQWAAGPVVILVMAREALLDRRSRWSGGRRGSSTVKLEPLDRARSQTLVSNLLAEGGVDVPEELVVRLADRSGGNPLFAEEMSRRLREQGEDESGALPESVEAVLGARLDSLGRRERTVIRSAAVIGERFWAGALAALPGVGELDLENALERLLELELIAPSRRSALLGDRQFMFRHELVQRVAYRRLPKAERAHRHAEIADYLDRNSEGELTSIVARHWARARELGVGVGLDEDFLEKAALECPALARARR